MKAEIEVWDRRERRVFTEKIYGSGALSFAYGSSFGRYLTQNFFKQSLLSKAYGALQSSSLSRRKIPEFIRQYGIDMSEFKEKRWASFNDFFVREFKPDRRPFAENTDFPAPCEARYLVFDRLMPDQKIPVKGFFLSSTKILASGLWEPIFRGGPCFVARLCPTDYHRYHVPDTGKVLTRYRAGEGLHSVNPWALKAFPHLLSENERRVTIYQTATFGRLAIVAVGAMMVGKILEVDRQNAFNRGDELGRFLFGGSTIIVFGEAGKWHFDDDLLEQSALGRETLVKLGERIGSSL